MSEAEVIEEDLDFKEGEPINLKGEPEEKPEEQPEAKQEEERPTNDGKEEPEKPRVEFNEDQQEVFNEAIARKVAAQREAERKAKELEERLAEQQRKLAQYETPEKPVVPPPPDPYDDDYEVKVKERDEAIKAAAQWERDESYRQEQQQKAYQEQVRQEQERKESLAKTFFERGDKVGHGQAELDAAVGSLVNHGLAGGKGEHIINHENGPDLAMYLAKNALESDKIAQMSDMQAAVYIESEIIPKVKALRESSKPDKSPPVVESPGAGVGIPDETWGTDGWTIT